MSNERFDRLMKKNLESVRPVYQPSAWHRFQKRLPTAGLWPRLLPYGGWVLSGLMLTGWLTTLYTLRENQLMMKQLLHTRTAITLPRQVHSLVPIHPQSSAYRVDTVYIVKRSIVEHRHRYYPADQVTTQIEQPGPADSLLSPLNLAKTRLTDTFIRNQNYTPSGQRYPKKRHLLTTKVLTKAGNESSVSIGSDGAIDRIGTRNPPFGNTMPGLGSNKASPQPSGRGLPLAAADSVNRAIAKATETIPADSSNLATKSAPATAIQLDSVAKSAGSTPSSISAAMPQSANRSRPHFRLASLQPRIGVEAMKALNGIGIGPSIELFPAENLGLSIGVQASKQQAENHQDLKGFNATMGTEFIEHYQAYLPAQYDQLKDISVVTNLISLPINLKYYVPLRRKWSLLFQTGTSLALVANQQIRYESTFNGVEQFHSFDVHDQPRLFHNFLIGAGLQYRLSRIAIQLSPYYLYDFSSLVNAPAGSNVGIKASIWLKLIK